MPTLLLPGFLETLRADHQMHNAYGLQFKLQKLAPLCEVWGYFPKIFLANLIWASVRLIYSYSLDDNSFGKR